MLAMITNNVTNSMGGKLYNILSGILFMTLMIHSPKNSFAEEIKPFAFTGFDGFIDLRYLKDDQSNKQTAPAKRTENREAYQEEIRINTHSYIYHPKFLQMDIGGGPVFVQNTISSDVTDTSGVQTIKSSDFNDTLFNYSARLNFLKGKDYPFTLYYERSNPLVSPSLDEQFLQKNTKYGANLTWRTPIVYTLQTSTYESKGSGFNLVVDEQIKQTNVRGYRSFGQDGYAQLYYQHNKVDSKSGSLSLPITPSSRTSTSGNFDMRYRFGEDKQYEIIGLLSQLKQNPEPNLTETRFSPEFRWKHSKTVKSFYKLNYVKSEQQTNTTTNSLLSAGIAEQNKVGFSQAYDVHSNTTTTSSTDEKVIGALARLAYDLPFKDGSLNLSASYNYDKRDQVATKSTIPVFNERHILNGTTPVNLNNNFVVAPVSTTVKVYNLSRSQQYVVDTDYRLLTIGSVTQIQRLAGGNIIDGEDVVVDYSYTSGGTFKSSVLDQDYQIAVNFFKYYNSFVRYRKIDNSLDEGVPTNSLNSSETRSYGGGINYPVSTWMSFAADTLYEEHDEEIASYDRRSTKYSMQFNMPLATTIDISRRQTVINQKTSAEDVDLVRNSIRLRMRPWLRASLSYTYSEEDDTGGSIPRSLKEHSLEFEWRVRAVTIRLDGRLVDENQGEFARDRESIHLSMRRDF